MTKAHKIIARFTSDPVLTKKIVGHADAVRHGKKTVDQIIDEHTKNPAIKAKVHALIKRVQMGQSIQSITGYHAVDQNVAHAAAGAAHEHKGAIKAIIKGH